MSDVTHGNLNDGQFYTKNSKNDGNVIWKFILAFSLVCFAANVENLSLK